MATIAKGIITLSSVNDAYSVSLSPSSCVINAKWNGEDPDFSNAFATLRVFRGEVAVPFQIVGFQSQYCLPTPVVTVDPTTMRIGIASIEDGHLSGQLKIHVKSGDDFDTYVSLPFTVVRETSMLDWILDWEGRKKTEIAGEHIITPKIFVGQSESGGLLTGTYIGPAFDNSGRTGIFGYVGGSEVFHIDNTGAFIGGWSIEQGGIQTVDSTMQILSEGTIISRPGGNTAWSLNKDGSATFANDSVHFYPDGSADFEGTITANDGYIGGWGIDNSALFTQHILLSSDSRYFGIRRRCSTMLWDQTNVSDFKSLIRKEGGVQIFSTNNASYGMEGWIPNPDYQNKLLDTHNADGFMVFSLGSFNYIAGWTFDNNSIYIGEKNNLAKQNTNSPGAITIGTNGLRGYSWYIDYDGEVSFVDGLLHFDKNGGTIAGWEMTPSRLATKKTALVSTESYSGLYISNADLPSSHTSFRSTIQTNGGIYLGLFSSGPVLDAHNTQGKCVFKLSSSTNNIAGWKFDHLQLYSGSSAATANSFDTSGNITLSPNGLRGYKFRFEADGSGAIAGGNVSWDKDGNVKLGEDVWLSWNSVTNTGTKITSAGMFTGSISADHITTGTISTASIQCKDKWALMQDGSGYVASKNISWQSDGTLNVKGCIDASSGSLGTGEEKFNITSSGIAYGDVSNWNTADISKKMLLNPASLKIQYSDPNNSSQVCKIYLGKEAWPNRATFFPYGTVAWIYKKDLANLEMDGSRCSEPAIRIDTITRYGSGVAISSAGAIISSGVIAEKGYYIETDTSMLSVVNLSPFSGSVFVVKNTVDNKIINLPHEGTVRFVLDLGVGESFLYRILIHSLPENKPMVLGAKGDDYTKFYYNGAAYSNNYTVKANTIHELTLVYDANSRISYWYIKNIT